MNLLQRIRDFFANKSFTPTAENLLWAEGHEALKKGEKLYEANQFQEAMKCLDLAIDRGFAGANVYFMRGTCLQRLDFDLDAIDDFDNVIDLEPEVANNYHMRALSKDSAGDAEGSIADWREAVRLSKIDSPLNRSFNEWANETGWSSVCDYFEHQLGVALQRNKFDSGLSDSHKLFMLEGKLARLQRRKR